MFPKDFNVRPKNPILFEKNGDIPIEQQINKMKPFLIHTTGGALQLVVSMFKFREINFVGILMSMCLTVISISRSRRPKRFL